MTDQIVRQGWDIACAWVRVDDQRWLNPKVLMLSMEADCLDVRGMQWSSAQRRDGLVVRNALPLLCGGMPAGRTPHDIAQELVDAGRWLPHPEGWLIHDFLEYQPSWADAEAQAQKRSDAARKAAEARWAKNDAESVPPACDEQCDSHAERIADGVPGHEASHRPEMPPALPGPAQPDPTPSSLAVVANDEPPAEADKPEVLRPLDVLGTTTRGTRLPQFTLSPAMIAWAEQHTPGVDVRRETEKFADYFRGLSGAKATKVDWLATWRNWLRNARPSTAPAAGRPISKRDEMAQALGLDDDFGSTWSPELQERLLGRTRNTIDAPNRQELTR